MIMASMSPSISSFSPLLKSDAIVALGQGRPQRCRLIPSFSTPDISGLGLSHTFGSIWNPNLLKHIQTHHPKVSTFVTAFNALRVQFSHLKHRIYGMETENNELRHANMILCSDSQALEQELSNLRAEYYAERFQSKVRVQCARADKDKIIILSDKLEQAEKFIMAMVDIKLHERVLGRAAEAIKEGADAEEALIEAVRVAATKKGSAWSRIIPAIVGPRSPEHYLSAINLALMLQKDLHEREKVSGFWKAIAKLDPVNANTITPSSSLLSEVGGQDVEHSISEQAVLDEMIALLARGDTLARKSQLVVSYSAEVIASKLLIAEDEISERAAASTSTVDLSIIQPELVLCPKLVSPVSSLPTTTKEHGTQATPLTKSPKTVKIAGDSPPTKFSQIPVSPLRSKAKTSQIAQSKLPSPFSPSKVISSISPAKQVSPPKISSKQPITPIRKTPSTPIRSRLSTPRTNTFKRPVLTSIDLNKPLVKADTSKIVTKCTIPANIYDGTIKKKPTRDHSKNLVKRRGVIMEEISHPPPSIVAENESTVLPMTAEIEIYEPQAPPLPSSAAMNTKENNPASTSISTEDPMHIPTPADKESSLQCPEFDLSPENINYGSLLAAQALQSLERICAAFSSDSLGSLEMTDAGSDYADGSQSDSEDLKLTNERNANAEPSASSSNLSHICKALHDLECSMASDNSFSEDVNFAPRPPTPVVKCSTWTSSTPYQHMSSRLTSSSSSSSSSESISIPAPLRSKKPFESDGSPTLARTSILASFKLSPIYPTDRLARSLNRTFYKAVPPSQNPNNGFQQPLLSSQNKPSSFPNVVDKKPGSFGFSPAPFYSKPRSNTINTVSPLPPTLSTPMPETLSSASPFKRRSNTINTVSPVSPTRRSPRPECLIPITKPRSNTINTTLPVSQPHTAKTISSSAKRRSNTLDSYLQVPSKNTKSRTRTKAVHSENDTTAPTAAFMRRPDVNTTPVNTRRMTNSAAPLIPNWSPALQSDTLSPTRYRNMLRGR